MNFRTKILALTLVIVALTASIASALSVRAQVSDDTVTTDATTSDSSSALSVDSSSDASAASSEENSSVLTRAERRVLENARMSEDSSDDSSASVASQESSSAIAIDAAASEDASVSSTSSEQDVSTPESTTDTGAQLSTETGSVIIPTDTGSTIQNTSSNSSESSSEKITQTFSGGTLLTDAVLGQPSNVYPSFLLPKTDDFSSIWDVQTRVHITLTDDAGLEQPVDETVSEGKEFYRITLAPPATFRPGKYRFQAALNHTRGFSAVLMNTFRKFVGADEASDLMLVDTYFNWGTIAVNVDQSSYRTGDSVLLSAAATTSEGKPLCIDTLTASFTEETKTLSPFCSGSGETLSLRAPSGTSATLITNASDADAERIVKQPIVLDAAPFFHITRTSVTRTEAQRTEQMTIRVTTDETLIGTITEHIAPGFEVANIQPAPTDINHNDDGTTITWDGSFQAGAGRTFSYTYQTGTISPLFAFFGPVRFRGQSDGISAPVVSSSDSSISSSIETPSLSSDISSSETSIDTSSTDSSLTPSDAESIASSESSFSSFDSSTFTSSEDSLSSESSSSDISFLGNIFQNLMASLVIDDAGTISFIEDNRWQLLVTTGTPDISVAERARRLTLERDQAVYAANASPTFKLIDTELDDTDTRLLNSNNNLRPEIAYQEILHSVVDDADVTDAIVDHLVAKAQDTTDFGSTTPSSIKEDTAVQETVAALVTDDAKDKLITSIADQIVDDATANLDTIVDTAATSVVQTQTEALQNAQDAVTQAVTENGNTSASPSTTDDDTAVLTVSLVGPNGTVIHPPFHFEVGSVDLVIDPIQSFVPGLYTVTVTVTNPITNETQTFTQQFAWGVLALNPDKDIYKQGDIAHIDFGALDDHGEIVCKADLTLTAIAPDNSVTVLSTANNTIIKTDMCGVKKAGLIDPDFWGELPLTQSGAYHLTLEGTIKGKTRAITSIIVVKNDAPFMISRLGATRLWPFADSPMDIKVKFNTDVTGQIVETVPAGFIVKKTEPYGAVSQDEDGTTHITWDGSWKTGDAPIFHYLYKAPEISPYFYLLGPIKIESDQPFTGAHLTASGQTID